MVIFTAFWCLWLPSKKHVSKEQHKWPSLLKKIVLSLSKCIFSVNAPQNENMVSSYGFLGSGTRACRHCICFVIIISNFTSHNKFWIILVLVILNTWVYIHIISYFNFTTKHTNFTQTSHLFAGSQSQLNSAGLLGQHAALPQLHQQQQQLLAAGALTSTTAGPQQTVAAPQQTGVPQLITNSHGQVVSLSTPQVCPECHHVGHSVIFHVTIGHCVTLHVIVNHCAVFHIIA